MWDSLNSDPCGACTSRPTDMSICEEMDDPYSFKENSQPFHKTDDLSMYDSSSAAPQSSELSHVHCSHGPLRQRSVEFHDGNSQDSGYGQSIERLSSYNSPTRLNSFESTSLCSMEDEFLDFTDVEPLEKSSLPRDFNKLIAGPIKQSPKNSSNKENESPNETIIRPLFRRALSLQTTFNDNTPNSSRVRTSLFRGGEDVRCFKRPDPPSLESSFEATDVKRSKMFEEEEDDEEAAVPTFRPVLRRAFSSTEESIMCAVQRSDAEPDLIGDFSKQFGLPLAISRHQDLKAITPTTLYKLMNGEYSGTIDSFKVIDCRYPYEFDGGHISGAINIYTKEQCLKLLEESPKTKSQRNILVFHCEFSSERGPNLYRYLRKEDRHRNQSDYPFLHYPEIYILEGGYKKFFEQFSEMCSPVAYKEMLHPDHEDDLKHFRQKSKTWNCDSRHRQMGRSVKRLGL